MSSGKKSKTNVTGRARQPKPRPVELVVESYRKPNGALGLRSYYQDDPAMIGSWLAAQEAA